MKEFKYTIDGKEYNVTIGEIDENNVAHVTVNGDDFKVQMEKEAEPEKKKVVLGKPAQTEESEAAPAANVNTNNAVKAPLPGTITAINVEVGQEVKAGDAVVVLEAMKMEIEYGDFSEFVSINDDELKAATGLERDDEGNIYDPLSKDMDNDGIADRYDDDFRDSDAFESTYDVEDNLHEKEEKVSILGQIKNYQSQDKVTSNDEKINVLDER